MTIGLSAATNKKKAIAVVCVTLVASAVVASTAPIENIEENTLKYQEAYLIPDFNYDMMIDARVATWIRFQDLRREWREARDGMSSVAEMAMLPAYQKIMGMGPNVLPHILTQLRFEGDKPDHWFWALAAIADANPVPPQSRGKVREMAKAWLEWGEKAGYVQLG
jgi:hypothetical protein